MVCISPNELMTQAKQELFAGKEPKNKEDWLKVVYFWTQEIVTGVQPAAIHLLCRLHDVPVEEDEVTAVCTDRKQQIEKGL